MLMCHFKTKEEIGEWKEAEMVSVVRRVDVYVWTNMVFGSLPRLKVETFGSSLFVALGGFLKTPTSSTVLLLINTLFKLRGTER